ncbi:glutathione hydrolase 5 proenzyme-like [Oreochromis aureus]|uniref:glutathione hydrolase 5 proenzyme-like n=1 Tax=Oreochromis aureus TaxID=47969 RepID=UPI0012BCB896|nr:glutathione hydrolase 5 proenzyme-like [Oreochromis aureus]
MLRSTKVLIVGAIVIAVVIIVGVPVGLHMRSKWSSGTSSEAAGCGKCSRTGWCRTTQRSCSKNSFKAAVAADSKNCSDIGRDILQKGGSAVDAAIAALLCTSIINPQSAGIGGGSIFTIMDSSGKVTIINSRETVPRNVNPDLPKSCPNTTDWKQDSKWIGVPGEIRGYAEAHRLYGNLSWAELFQPAIDLARNGSRIEYVHGQYIQRINNTSIRKLYSVENGNLLKTGDTVEFGKLADTLKMIANEGPDVFYNGTIAKNLISDIQDAGGKLTLEDLASYKVKVTDAWNISLGEYQMYFPPPPAGGAILSLILNIMKGYKINKEPNMTDEKIFFYHRYIEALKFANGLKKHIRDPEFNPDNFTEMAKNLTEDSYADYIRSLITNETHAPEFYGDTQYVDSTGTTHVSVLAEDGSAVSVTSSINDIFGSKVLSPSTGIILNNQLSDFCERRDNISPGERPPSSMAPAVLKSESETLVIGGSGSTMITTGMASALINHLWFNKTLEDAIKAQVFFVNSKYEVMFEPELTQKDLLDSLKAWGHNITTFYNVVNAVEKKNGSIYAWSDERKKGKAAGY